MLVFGTRPEAIKLAPVAYELKQRGFASSLVNTGQHDELLPTILEWFNVTVDEDLDTLTEGQSLSQLTAKMIGRLDSVLERRLPSVVVVQGDTVSSVVGALCAFYRGVPVAHVEAGLRTYDSSAPFPEEVLRRIVSLIATWNFTPSRRAAENLVSEHVTGKIRVTGNTVVDALITIRKHALPVDKPSGLRRVVVTVHRRENHRHLTDILGAIRLLSEDPQLEVFLSVHPNPMVQSSVTRVLFGSRVNLLRPLDYLPWIGLLQSADLIVTDSGGLQEEAPVLGVPLVVVRSETERPEIIEQGYGVLVGHNPEHIVAASRRLLTMEGRGRVGYPYGDGTAASQIVKYLASELKLTSQVSESDKEGPS